MNFVQCSFILCIVLLLIVRNTNSAASYTPNSENPDFPGMCYYKDSWSSEESKTPFLLKPGQKRKHPKNCIKVECSETLGLYIESCGVYGHQGHCRIIPGDKSRPYPYCCPELIC